MNILIVSPWLPHAAILHAGGQHVYHTVRSLVERGHHVHVLCYGRGEATSQIDTLSAVCASLSIITPAYAWHQKLTNLQRGGWRRPWLLGRRTHHDARAQIQRICRDQKINVIHFFWTEMGRYLRAAPSGVGTILGTLDVEYLVRPREVALYPPGWARIQARWRAKDLIRNEPLYVRGAHITLACSNADRSHLARLASVDRIHVVHPWVDTDVVRNIQPAPVATGHLTFMGAMDRMANIAAARFLIDEVWPLVRSVQPDATLRIVGAHPPDMLHPRVNSDPRLEVTGYVPDLAAQWATTDVAVSPSLIGGGLITKVAQPMAAGRPVVTTTLGNEGVDAPAGIAVEVADNGPDFAAAVLRLLSDRDHRAQIAEAGRRHVLEAFDWTANMDGLEAAYQAAMTAADH